MNTVCELAYVRFKMSPILSISDVSVLFCTELVCKYIILSSKIHQ